MLSLGCSWFNQRITSLWSYNPATKGAVVANSDWYKHSAQSWLGENSFIPLYWLFYCQQNYFGEDNKDIVFILLLVSFISVHNAVLSLTYNTA